MLFFLPNAQKNTFKKHVWPIKAMPPIILQTKTNTYTRLFSCKFHSIKKSDVCKNLQITEHFFCVTIFLLGIYALKLVYIFVSIKQVFSHQKSAVLPKGIANFIFSKHHQRGFRNPFFFKRKQCTI